MFNKLKQYKDLRSQAKSMQNALSQETVTEVRDGVIVEINGNLEILRLSLNQNLPLDKQEKILTICLNDALKKIQRMMEEKMRDLKGFEGLM